jgi:hypothetical protein
MTVNIFTTRIAYLADGVTTTYTYPFRVDHPLDLVVWVDEKITPVVLTGLGQPTGGTFVFALAPGAGSSIVAERNSPRTQTTEYLEHDIHAAEVEEDSFDRVVMLIQELQTQLDRAVQFTPTDDLTGISVAFPMPGAGKFIRWNTAGTALEAVEVSGTGGGGGTAGVSSLGGATGDIGLLGDPNIRLFITLGLNALTVAWQGLLPLTRGGTNNDGSTMPAGGVVYRSPIANQLVATLPGTAPRRPVLTFEGAPGFTDFVTVSSVSTDGQGGVRLFPWGPNVEETGELRFYAHPTTGLLHFVGFKAPDQRATDTIYVLPSVDGTNGQVLATDATGHLFWVTPSGATGGGVTGNGVPGQVAYWNGTSSLTGSVNFTWNEENPRLLTLFAPVSQYMNIGPGLGGAGGPNQWTGRLNVDAAGPNAPQVFNLSDLRVSSINGGFANVAYGHVFGIMHDGATGAGGFSSGAVQGLVVTADQALAGSTVSQLLGITGMYRVIAGTVGRAAALTALRNQGHVGSLTDGIGLLIPAHAAPLPVNDIAIWTLGGEHRFAGNLIVGEAFEHATFPLEVFYDNAAGNSPLINTVLLARATTVHDGHGPGIGFFNHETATGQRNWLGHIYVARTGQNDNAYLDIALTNHGLMRVALRIQDWGTAHAIVLPGAAPTQTTELLWMTPDNSHFVGLTGPQTVEQSVIWILPTTVGTAGQVLTTDGSANLFWGAGGGTGLGTFTYQAVPYGGLDGKLTQDVSNLHYDPQLHALIVGAYANTNLGALTATGTGNEGVVAVRVQSTVNTSPAALTVWGKTTGTAQDGNGTAIAMVVQDPSTIALGAVLYTYRVGNNQTFRFGIQTNVGGSAADRLYIDQGGSVSTTGHFSVNREARFDSVAAIWLDTLGTGGENSNNLQIRAARKGLWIDNSDYSQNGETGLFVVTRLGETVAGTRMKSSIEVDSYTPPDNGGFIGGIGSTHSGGGNAITGIIIRSERPAGRTAYPNNGFAGEFGDWDGQGGQAACLYTQIGNAGSTWTQGLRLSMNSTNARGIVFTEGVLGHGDTRPLIEAASSLVAGGPNTVASMQLLGSGHLGLGAAARSQWMSYIFPTGPAGATAGLFIENGNYFMSMPIEDPRPGMLQVHKGYTTASSTDLKPALFASLISRSTLGGETGTELAPAAILAYARLQDVHTTGTVCALEAFAEMVTTTNQDSKGIVDGSDGGVVGIRAMGSCMVRHSYAWGGWFQVKDNGTNSGLIGIEINTSARYGARAFGDVRGMNLVNDPFPIGDDNNDIGMLIVGYGTVFYQLGAPRVFMDLTATAFTDAFIKTGTDLLIKKANGTVLLQIGGAGPGGIKVGSPATDPGVGSINVSGNIQKNGTAYTNPGYVFEDAFTGAIERYADREGAGSYPGLQPLPAVEAFVREHWEFPHLYALGPTRGLFDGGDAILATLEEAYLYLFDHERRLTDHELRLQRLEHAIA